MIHNHSKSKVFSEAYSISDCDPGAFSFRCHGDDDLVADLMLVVFPLFVEWLAVHLPVVPTGERY
jgi:hypothetical protein